ncbi:hypothetical protein GGQ87_002171 [Brevundimonas alba]|uniref:Uncharacterized protein n=1 Tax=Brevundimonas alba TaxID=74314 RepID=A0A7X5YL12_9CAUL|nr:hypothetical protein [Brevundimonas alba]NJC41876.1 hypothetical protein [Brevundimonas alba]
MLETIYSQIFAAVAVLVVAFAFFKGDEPERITAGSYALIILATLMIRDGGSLSVPRWGVMALDILLLVVLVGLVWHSRRAWLVWASAFQGLIVAGHLLVAANLRPPSDAFATVNNLANYGLLVAMAVGTFWAWQERRAATMGAG